MDRQNNKVNLEYYEDRPTDSSKVIHDVYFRELLTILLKNEKPRLLRFLDLFPFSSYFKS